MRVSTSRFGSIDIDDEDTFAVPHGIPGFVNLRFAALLTVEAGGDEPFLYWLQDLRDPDLAFLCVVPWSVFPTYDVDFDERSLGIANPDHVRLLNLVTVRRNGDVPLSMERRGSTMTANLRAPLVIDLARRTIHQVILNDARWSVHEPLRPTQQVVG